MDQAKKPITIKKYANRRLYNTETSSYVTLDDLAEMVRGERDFVVFDAKTGEDLTHSVLTQIILEQEGRGQSLLPVKFLRQLIRFYGDSMSRLVPSYLDMSMETLTREQERFRKQMTDTWGTAAGAVAPFGAVPFGAAPFGKAALDAMQEQTRHNMALFEKAMSLWSPFPKTPRAAGPNGGDKGSDTPAPPEMAPARPSEPVEPEQGNILVLREQMQAMQRQLDRLSRGER